MNKMVQIETNDLQLHDTSYCKQIIYLAGLFKLARVEQEIMESARRVNMHMARLMQANIGLKCGDGLLEKVTYRSACFDKDYTDT